MKFVVECKGKAGLDYFTNIVHSIIQHPLLNNHSNKDLIIKKVSHVTNSLKFTLFDTVSHTLTLLIPPAKESL